MYVEYYTHSILSSLISELFMSFIYKHGTCPSDLRHSTCLIFLFGAQAIASFFCVSLCLPTRFCPDSKIKKKTLKSTRLGFCSLLHERKKISKIKSCIFFSIDLYLLLGLQLQLISGLVMKLKVAFFFSSFFFYFYLPTYQVFGCHIKVKHRKNLQWPYFVDQHQTNILGAYYGHNCFKNDLAADQNQNNLCNLSFPKSKNLGRMQHTITVCVNPFSACEDTFGA